MNPIATLAAAMPESEPEEVPSASVVAQLKAQYQGRTLNRVEMEAEDGTSFVFVMTGPSRVEWKKYQDEIVAAAGNADRQQKVLENAALAQIRWPSREEAVGIFDLNPGLIINFAETLNKLARVEVTVTSKKL